MEPQVEKRYIISWHKLVAIRGYVWQLDVRNKDEKTLLLSVLAGNMEEFDEKCPNDNFEGIQSEVYMEYTR